MMRRTIRIPYRPFEAQREIHDHPARFRIAVCGRRFGKTTLAANEIIKQAIQKPGSVNWWVAPTYQISMKGWRAVLRYLPHELLKEPPKKVERCITLINDATIWYKSADNPDSLISEGLDFLVVDEAARISEDAYDRALRPALSDKIGSALFITTPKGRNWFYYLYLRGMDGAEADYQSFVHPTWDNPYILQDEIEEARRTLPERIFNQEYGAEFVESGGEVFVNVRELAVGQEEEVRADQNYVIGVDWGKYQDYTVFMVMDTTGHVVKMERIKGMDYEMQIKKLRVLADQYRPIVIMPEMNSMGDPLVERLQRELPYPVEGFLTTASSKRELIENLAIAMERKEITYPNYPDLIGELEAFEYEVTAAGNVRYHAPEGTKWHDDCVMALALAYHASKKFSSPRLFRIEWDDRPMASLSAMQF